MSLDPTIAVAVIALAGVIFGPLWAARKDRNIARISADTDGLKVTAELDVRREELLTAGIEAHFNRLEQQLADAEARYLRLVEQLERAEERIDGLTERVRHLEVQRERMLSWMALNQLGWPPPDDSGI